MLTEILETIPREDPEVSNMVNQGRTIGCFQIESPGMRATLKEVKARSVDDIMVALSLYRPGPLTGGLKDAFVRRHLGKEATEYLHPALSTLLADTYGVILYQEQVLRIAHELAGFQPGRCRPAASGDVTLRPREADADLEGEIRGWSLGAEPGARGYRQPHLGADGSICRVRLPESPRGVVCTGELALCLVQDTLPGIFHGSSAGELGRLLQPAHLHE